VKVLKGYLDASTIKLDPITYLQQVGENSVVIKIIDDKQASLKKRNMLIKNCLNTLLQSRPAWLIDYIVSYDALLLVFDLEQINFSELLIYLHNHGTNISPNNIAQTNSPSGVLHTIDACYTLNTDKHPNDIDLVVEATSLKKEEIISLHQGIQYQVFAIGFMPNFAYLGELPEKLQIPRLKHPRLKVPAGAVAIADNQTAVYPSETPGGWHIIAYSAFTLAKNGRFGPNDFIKFNAVDENTYYQQVKRALT
jgi:KipI family sensor histidine kinase inhibitor